MPKSVKVTPPPAESMKAEDFTRLKVKLFKDDVQAGAALGVHPNTIRNWTHGRRRIPYVVGRYMELRLELARLAAKA